eukprot:2699124-Prymnesium_polylepis.2
MLVGLALLVSLLQPGTALLKTLQRDWAALNMRSTARHLMRPLTPAGRADCLRLKKELREAVTSDGVFVVDVFAALAEEHSVDEETRVRGGLLGERLTSRVIAARASSTARVLPRRSGGSAGQSRRRAYRLPLRRRHDEGRAGAARRGRCRRPPSEPLGAARAARAGRPGFLSRVPALQCGFVVCVCAGGRPGYRRACGAGRAAPHAAPAAGGRAGDPINTA